MYRMKKMIVKRTIDVVDLVNGTGILEGFQTASEVLYAFASSGQKCLHLRTLEYM